MRIIRFPSFFFFAFCAAFFMVCGMSEEASAAASFAKHPYPVVELKTDKGTLHIELYPDIAPRHAERIQALCAQKFYDGIRFHRVVPGFVAQAGDPKSKAGMDVPGLGSGGSDMPDLPLEVSRVQKNTRGALAAARTQDPNSANSQFYIVLQNAPHLDMQYTVFGRVLGKGMEVVDKITPGSVIESMRVIKP
jgi:peptidylprolyl isomerase